jgi:uncharacterized membrane protein
MQFSIREGFLKTAFMAIALAAPLGTIAYVNGHFQGAAFNLAETAKAAVISGSLWITGLVAAFAIGRRSLTESTVLGLVCCHVAGFLALLAWLK